MASDENAESSDQPAEATAAQPPSLEVWGETVGEEVRKTFQRFLATGFFDKYMTGQHVLDIGYKGYLEDVHPILPHAIGVDLDYPGGVGSRLPFDDESQDAVFSSHALERIADYRQALGDWFRVLRIGGHLIVVTPHQFLYERRAQPPSNWNADHKRFYTAASLLREIEEAIDPASFRVRMLEDNDAGYDYARPLSEHPTGSYEIICVLQKIARPAWADAMFAQAPAQRAHMFPAVPPFDPDTAEPVKLITTTSAEPHRVLVLKLDHRGDFILAGDGFEALRRNFGAAHLTLVCGSWNRADAERSGLFDEVLAFNYYREQQAVGAPFRTAEDARDALSSLLGERNFDLAIDLRISGDTRHFLRAIDAKLRAGFGSASQFDYLDIAAPLSQATIVGRASNQFFGAALFSTHENVNRGYVIDFGAHKPRTDRKFLIFGPYANLTQGRYSLRFLIESQDGPLRLGYDICADGGRLVLSIGEIALSSSDGPGPIWFDVPAPVDQVQFRICPVGDAPVPAFRFFGCAVQREGDRSGVHQSEAMLILADLAYARSRRSRNETAWTTQHD